MTTKNLILAAIVLVILGGGIFFLSSQNKGTTTQNLAPIVTGEPQPTMQQESTPAGMMKAEENTVTYTDAGYTPATLRVKKGTQVTFKNQSGGAMWTASAIHPTHNLYPGSDIDNCGKAVEGTMFDSCKGIAAGDSWSFTFSNVGSWKYHNHLRASHGGTIIVE